MRICGSETRAIDSHRTNSRILKKALRLKEKDDLLTVIHVNGATITDNYWIKPLDSSLKYADIRFSDDYFSKLALNGSYDDFNSAAKRGNTRTPELTNIGSFEKCWKLKDGKWWIVKSANHVFEFDGKWWMYKTANHDELFSELFVCEFGKLLKMNMAVYERGKGVTKSLDFTDGANVNFEPASAFMGDNEDYEDVIVKLNDICPQAIPDYIRMIFLDTIVVNPDRHTSNFGLLRDINTGKLLRLAPMFDHNMALISSSTPKIRKSSDVLIDLFRDVIVNHPEYKEYIPIVNRDMIKATLDNLHMRVKKNYITDLIMSRYELTIL